jgi:uncharacterized coiled-coil protein SlyX
VPVAPAAPVVEPVAPVAPAVDEYQFIITTDSGVTLRFKTQDELTKHIANQHKTIERFNGERGQIGELKRKTDTLESQLREATAKLTSFEQSRAQAPASEQPAYQQQQVPQGEDIIRKMSDELAQLKQRVETNDSMNRAEKDNAIWQARFGQTVAEVNSIASAYPSLKTGMPWEKINEICAKQPQDYAALVPPEDQARFEKTLEILKYRYETTPEGAPDITRPKLSQKAAIAAWRAESGEDALVSANLHQASATSTVEAISRAANRSPSLPATAPSQPSSAEIANIDEAKAVLDAAQKNVAAYARDPILNRKLRQAQMFVTSLQ